MMSANVGIKRKTMKKLTVVIRSVLGLRNVLVLASVLSLGLVSWSQAYTVVTVSTAAPQGLEQSFLDATTNQFLATLFKNPLASNTWSVKLFDVNPNYNTHNPPPTTLEQALSLGATVYLYGFMNGIQDERDRDLSWFTAPIGALGWNNGGFLVNCSSPTWWNGVQQSSMTQQLVSIDSTTCNAVLVGVYNTIWNQNFGIQTVTVSSTTTPPPGRLK